MASVSTQVTNRDSSLLKVKTSWAEPKLEHTVASSYPNRSPRLGPPGVIARLQALFPPSPTVSHDAVALPSPSSPDFIKIRIITWNMHDSLPKGNLEELLGSVPSYTPRSIINDSDRMALPGLSLEEAYPYHIVVVGGQECPTLSGIPMGLAANFKHWDVKEREKEKHKDHDPEKDRGRDKSKERHLLHHTKSLLSKHLKHEHPPDNPRFDHAEDHQTPNPALTSGWSAVLEDWFANGVGSLHDVKPVVTTTVPDLGESNVDNQYEHDNVHTAGNTARTGVQKPATPDSNSHRSNTLDVNWQSIASGVNTDSFSASEAQAKTGPYELLVKERLMGIYMAIYVHRDVWPLVQGVSTGTVPAGLMGGRLGNKGGVGVSVNFRGTTLLFINAHLAAHEDKVPLRVANLAKIKAELPLESFLSPDDPRTFAEDLTDKFDHTWIFGDLNFRLDISRLHADWLVSRKEYSQALAFDQLTKLIKDGDPTFAGLHEATINFPPTFKYDVLRTAKLHEKRRSRRAHQRSRSNLNEIEEKENVLESEITHHEENDDEEMGDGISLGSSTWTSNHSKHRIDTTEDGSDHSSISSHVGRNPTSNPTSKLVSHAALKAKAAWLALLNASRDAKVNNLPLKRRHRRGTSAARLGVPGSSIELSRGTGVNPSPSMSSLNFPIPRRAASAKSTLACLKPEDEDKGVYDSSSKQRVPSWCDRILWKTTVEATEDPAPEPEFEPEAEPNRSRGRANRVGQLLSQAFRSRVRRDSTQVEVDSQGLSHEHTVQPGLRGASLTGSPGLYQSRSLEPLPSNPTQHIASPIGYGGRRRPRSVSAMAASSERVPRRFSLPVSSRPVGLLLPPQHTESDPMPAPLSQDNLDLASSTTVPVQRVPPKRWFFNFRSRDHGPSPSPANSTDPPSSRQPKYRKGDVVCLSYRTLDDQQMRRLEGRSDHRPVIGSYAIYI